MLVITVLYQVKSLVFTLFFLSLLDIFLFLIFILFNVTEVDFYVLMCH